MHGVKRNTRPAKLRNIAMALYLAALAMSTGCSWSVKGDNFDVKFSDTGSRPAANRPVN